MAWYLGLRRYSCGDVHVGTAASVSRRAQRDAPASLARLRRSPLLTHCLEPLQCQLQPLPPELRTRDHLLDVLEHVRVPNFFPQLLKKGMNLAEYEKHLPAYCRLNEQLLTQRSLQHKGCGHAP